MNGIEASEIIDFLHGTSAVAKLLEIKPPSVHEWRRGGIPTAKLMRLAPVLEARPGTKWTRRSLFPDDFHKIWPELAAPGHAAIEARDIGRH